jgi:Ca2+-binding RTX toxin-like protein
MRLRFAICCVLCIPVAAAPAAGSAREGVTSTVSSFPAERGPAGTVVLGGPSANSVTLDIDAAARQYIVSDAAGITAGNGCTSLGSQTARCTKYSSPGEYFRAALRGGDDTFQMVSQVPKGLGLEGGDGADKLLAGAGTDVALGGQGADTLSGRAGPDRLFGDRGHDRLIGGDGKDRLHADDDDADRAINCGSGDDIVFADRGEDPKLVGCERIRLR